MIVKEENLYFHWRNVREIRGLTFSWKLLNRLAHIHGYQPCKAGERWSTHPEEKEYVWTSCSCTEWWIVSTSIDKMLVNKHKPFEPECSVAHKCMLSQLTRGNAQTSLGTKIGGQPYSINGGEVSCQHTQAIASQAIARFKHSVAINNSWQEVDVCHNNRQNQTHSAQINMLLAFPCAQNTLATYVCIQ